jgi:gamma-glutamyl hercynylcysteine S-oxide synthase
MATTTATTVRSDSPPSPVQTLVDLQQARRDTLALVGPLGEADLERVHSPIMSPLVWDLGHIAAYEDLWLAHRHGGMPLLRPDLADLYDAFETPRAVRGEIDALGTAEARAYLEEVRARTVDVIAHQGVGDGFTSEMVLRHELQHSETMRQTMAIAGLLSDEDQAAIGRPLAELQAGEWIEVPPGRFQMGAGPETFAYDNEHPRHAVETTGFRIARQPVSCESWLRFAEGGGYDRREWWSAEGWAWKQEHQIAPDPALTALDPRAPACHISWFEANAFARAHDARLPSEAEWERAAGCSDGLGSVGRVWEWTATPFHGYPGFVAYPYREYSEVFFGEDYRVLRGGSWATNPRVASLTVRNWDLPQRRQIFAGLRLASDAT